MTKEAVLKGSIRTQRVSRFLYFVTMASFGENHIQLWHDMTFFFLFFFFLSPLANRS